MLLTVGCSVTTVTTTATTAPTTTTTSIPATTVAPTTTTATVTTTTATTTTEGPAPVVTPQTRSSESSLYRLTVVTPVVTNVDHAAAINEAIADTIGRLVDQFLVQAGQAGIDEIAGPNVLHISYELGLLNHRVVSVAMLVSTYWSGAAHPSSVVSTMTFVDGAPVDISTIVEDPSGLASTIADLIPDSYWATPQDLLDNVGGAEGLLAITHFFVTDQGLVALYDQYAVAPGAAGIVRIFLPYDMVPLTEPLASVLPES
jgi:hypothetical protein